MDQAEPKPTVKYIGIPADRAWFDPALLLAATELTYDTFAIGAGQSVLVAPPDPRRIALGFAGLSGGSGMVIGPWPDVKSIGMALTGPHDQMTWYTTREHLTLPSLGWYAFHTAGGPLRVVSIIRQ